MLRVLMGLYGEQVAAFYIPEQHALYTFKDQAWTGSMDKMVLSHELVHALQDQHFDVGKLPLKLKTNDDMVLATAAFVEGDATVLMMRWYANHAEMGGALQDLLSVFAQNTKALGDAPEFLRESLIFPYQQGERFVSALVTSGGLEAVNRAFASPPVSTEQVLHPAKYLGDRDDPVAVTPPYALLRFTVFDVRGERPPASLEGGITYKLTEREGKTVLWISQGDFSTMVDGRKYRDLSEDIWDRALTRIKRLSEGRGIAK